ncbi:uncharacterized protein LOC110020856 [Phalaenopsis equestris]|uniref:uncharacterized protein LOC110020856 n=1 Tax=Phalaenopsis equestris TaxID=78828 RepID=UPI0009E55756|nr:uncharacterized protein LOC110020856 [Phalaenopsis equestris]
MSMTVMSRLERLDLMLLCLEEIKVGGGGGGSGRLSSGLSAAGSSGGVEELMTATDGGSLSESSVWEKKRGWRNMEEAIVEMQVKGSLIHRIAIIESRLLQLEENMKLERKREMQNMNGPTKSREKKKHGGFKSILKFWLKRKSLKTKD